MSESKGDLQFWRNAAPDGPWREFQNFTESNFNGKGLSEFLDFWTEKLGYSRSSVSAWLRGERSIPAAALRKVGIEVDDQTRSVKVVSSEASVSALARQAAIDMMCNGCALGDRFCRISDCPLRPFSPKPLHPRANPMGWDRVGAE